MKENISNNATAKWCRRIARGLLLIITTLIFVFSILSGAEEYGGGLRGLIHNSPNALPAICLYIITAIAWKWELVGGLIIISFGIFSFFFFNVHHGNAFVLFFMILPILIIGLLFLFSWHKSKSYR